MNTSNCRRLLRLYSNERYCKSNSKHIALSLYFEMEGGGGHVQKDNVVSFVPPVVKKNDIEND